MSNLTPTPYSGIDALIADSVTYDERMVAAADLDFIVRERARYERITATLDAATELWTLAVGAHVCDEEFNAIGAIVKSLTAQKWAIIDARLRSTPPRN